MTYRGENPKRVSKRGNSLWRHAAYANQAKTTRTGRTRDTKKNEN